MDCHLRFKNGGQQRSAIGGVQASRFLISLIAEFIYLKHQLLFSIRRIKYMTESLVIRAACPT
jgi:hypothetical protein